MKLIAGILIALMLAGAAANSTDLQDKKKAPVRIYLEQFRSTKTNRITVRVLAKTEKRYLPAAGVEVVLYASEISETNLLGTIVTTHNGIGIYTFTTEQFEVAKSAMITEYIAVVNESEIYQRKEAKIITKNVNLEVEFVVEDSVKQVHVHVSETDSTGNKIPQKKVEIKLLVERPLSSLPLGDESNRTDEGGDVSMEFPDDLPGDAEGYLKVLVRIIENEDYGTVEASEIKQWGVPTVVVDNTLKRSLWASSANAPISLLIFINALIIAVWGILFYIVFQILVIRKIGLR